MKKLASVLAVLALVASAQAGVILSEDFEGATAGTSVNGYNGWSGTDNVVISSNVVDSGQSAGWSDGTQTWDTNAAKTFSYTLGAGESYVLTATLYSPQTTLTDAEIQIRNSSNPDTQMQGITICYGDMQFGVLNGYGDVHHYTPQPVVAMDIKMILDGTSSHFYYRENGTTEWTDGGGFTGLGWSASDYDLVSFSGHGGYAGGIDSIQLEVVPEPATMTLLGAGALGVLIRRKK